MSDITVRLSPDSSAGKKLLRLQEKLGINRTELVAQAVEMFYQAKRSESISRAAKAVRMSVEEGDDLMALQNAT